MAQRVIYIAGYGHSGSTLLDMILGSHSRFQNVGEFNRRMAGRLFGPAGEQDDCACGVRVRDCEFWNDVIAGLKTLEADLDALAQQTAGQRDHAAFVQAVLAATDSDVYVESSKSCTRLEALLKNPDLSVSVIQLVRDPRAVAHSCAKRHGNHFAFLAKCILRHVQLARVKWRYRPQWQRVSYEDLASNPQTTIARIMEFCGAEFEPGRQLEFASNEHHQLAGNLMRHNRKQSVRLDLKYLDNLPTWRWLLSTVLAFPFLLAHAYPLTKDGIRKRFQRSASG